MKQTYTKFLTSLRRNGSLIAWFLSGVVVSTACFITVYMHTTATLTYTFPRHSSDRMIFTTDQRLLDGQILEQHASERRVDRGYTDSTIVQQEVLALQMQNDSEIVSSHTKNLEQEFTEVKNTISEELAISSSSAFSESASEQYSDDNEVSSSVSTASSVNTESVHNESEALESSLSSAYVEQTIVEDTTLHEAPPVSEPLEPDKVSENLVIHPVSVIPNWGAMTSAAEWNRGYDTMPKSAYVSVPKYDIAELTIPMQELQKNRKQNEKRITAKLYYSTRHFGGYDLDSGEYSWKHAGIDLKLPLGTPFGTIADGVVYDVRSDSILGTHVIIEHTIKGNTYYSIYGHMQTSYVEPGQRVYRGELIGTVGNSATEVPHIHLQVNRTDPEWRSVRLLSPEMANLYTVHPIEFIEQY